MRSRPGSLRDSKPVSTDTGMAEPASLAWAGSPHSRVDASANDRVQVLPAVEVMVGPIVEGLIRAENASSGWLGCSSPSRQASQGQRQA